MNNEMKKALRSRAGYDWDTHRATQQRNADQINSIPAPEYPALGTARIGAIIAEARARRDAALLRMAGDGAGGMRTARPLDDMIPSTSRADVSPPPAAATSARSALESRA